MPAKTDFVALWRIAMFPIDLAPDFGIDPHPGSDAMNGVPL
jgi:hypothetical protein